MSYPYLSDLMNAVFGTSLHLPIPMFGTMVVIAIGAATMLVRREVERQEMSGILPRSTSPIVADLSVVSVIAGFVGARLFHILDHWSQFVADPAWMIFARAGFSIFGGLCFGVIAALIFLKRRSIPIRAMLDAAAPAMLLGYAIGRLGCQLAGDGDWGIAAKLALKPAWLPDWLWAQTYEGNRRRGDSRAGRVPHSDLRIPCRFGVVRRLMDLAWSFASPRLPVFPVLASRGVRAAVDRKYASTSSTHCSAASTSRRRKRSPCCS